MPKPEDSIEAMLGRLMPPAMSEAGQRSIEAMLDELAATQPPTALARPAAAAHWRRWLTSGIAATGMAAALIWSTTAKPPATSPVAQGETTANEPAGLVLVDESDRVESMTDEGWQEDPDGSAMHAMRLNVVEENRLLDEETGIVMQISQPREEILLMPVSTF